MRVRGRATQPRRWVDSGVVFRVCTWWTLPGVSNDRIRSFGGPESPLSPRPIPLPAAGQLRRLELSGCRRLGGGAGRTRTNRQMLWNVGVSDQLTSSDTLHSRSNSSAFWDLQLRPNAWWSCSGSNQPPECAPLGSPSRRTQLSNRFVPK